MGDDVGGREHAGRRVVAVLLRGGLAAATLLMAMGITTKLMSGDTTTPALELNALVPPRTPADGLLGAGVLTLVATPFVRVLVLAVVWWRAHDRRFVLTALVVLVLLAAATLLGGG